MEDSMKSQRAGDIGSGVFLALLGLVVIWASFRIKGAPDVMMQPRTLPLILGATVGAAGLALAVRAWRYRGPVRLVAWPDAPGFRRVAVTLGALAAFLFFLQPLGFPLGSVLLVGFLTWYLGRYKPIYAALLGLATGGTVYYVFIRLLELSFPAGLFGR
jgi:putative tricarboxylic transport membrane protein